MVSKTRRLELIKDFRFKHGARGDIQNKEGVTAAEIMQRKRSPIFRSLAKKLSTA